MKNIKIKYLIGVAAAGLMLSSCDRSYPDPDPIPVAELEPNITIAELKEVYSRGPTEVLSDLTFKARVASTDQYGNLYRIMYVQDETGGMEIKVGKSGLYNFYKIGQTVYIKARGLWLGSYGGMISLGMENQDPTTTYENTYIDVQYLIDRTIFPGPSPGYGEAILEPYEVTSLDELTTRREGTYVKLVGAQYSGFRSASFQPTPGNYINIDTITTWAVPAYPNNPDIAIPASYAVHDFTLDGKTIQVRTSGYARFAGERVENRAPKGTLVDISGIYTTYNGTKQLVLNTTRDVVPHQPTSGDGD